MKAGKAITSSNGRLAALFACSLILCLLDFYGAPRTDPHAHAGKGYRHHVEGLDSSNSDFEVMRGWRRVRLNFKHFFLFWFDFPGNWKGGFVGLVTSDGNSFANNFYGHFIGSVVLSAAGLWLSRSLLCVGICGTLVNICHEYVAEGQYVDPSFIDLWLDQFGLILSMGGFALIQVIAVRKTRKSDSDVESDSAPVRLGSDSDF